MEEPAEEAPADGEAGEEAATVGSGMRYRKQRRGGKGVRDIRTSERNGLVMGVSSVRDTDDIMLITTGGMVNRTHVREIRVVGRNTQGVRIMGLKEGDKIASIAKVAEEEGEALETDADAGNADAGRDRLTMVTKITSYAAAVAVRLGIGH